MSLGTFEELEKVAFSGEFVAEIARRLGIAFTKPPQLFLVLNTWSVGL